MDNTFKRNIIINLFWSFLGQGGYLITGLAANIILARILSPYEFGQVGIIMFFIIIAKVLTESGLSGALIRKNDATEEDFSTVFIFNLGISITLMLLLIVFSGVIASFYDTPELKPLLMVASSILLINSLQITHNAKLVKDLKFKKKATYEFISIFFASIIGVVLAINSAGVWAILVMQISTAIILTSILWIFEEPIKSYRFSRKSFHALYRFGINTTLASLLNTAFDNIYQLILGKCFAITQTGLFFHAKKLQEIPVGVIKSATMGVVYSSLAKVQHVPSQFNKLYEKAVTIFTILVGLICLLIFFYANNIILLLYGPKWLGSVFYMQVLIIASYFYMQEMFNRVIFKVFDKTEKIFYLEVVSKCIQSVTIIVGIFYKNINSLLYGFLVTSILSFLINYYVSKKLQNSLFWEELVIVFKVIFISIFTVMIGILTRDLLLLKDYYSFTLLPLLLILFFLGIKILRVTDVFGDIKTISRIFKT